MPNAVEYFELSPPLPGETIEIAPGVHWLRMPLPFRLNHINLWLLEDGEGWTLIDTGIHNNITIALWENSIRKAGQPAYLESPMHPLPSQPYRYGRLD